MRIRAVGAALAAAMLLGVPQLALAQDRPSYAVPEGSESVGRAVSNGFYLANQIVVSGAGAARRRDTGPSPDQSPTVKAALDHVYVQFIGRRIEPVTLRAYLRGQDVDPSRVIDVREHDTVLIVTVE